MKRFDAILMAPRMRSKQAGGSPSCKLPDKALSTLAVTRDAGACGGGVDALFAGGAESRLFAVPPNDFSFAERYDETGSDVIRPIAPPPPDPEEQAAVTAGPIATAAILERSAVRGASSMKTSLPLLTRHLSTRNRVARISTMRTGPSFAMSAAAAASAPKGPRRPDIATRARTAYMSP